MADINIGVNLIEILTTGMYQDARTIFREYVQNSCDAIDKAGGGSISIILNANDGYICIADNGCGIPAADFKETLRNIAQSEKSSAVDKGFRGIGKLCGLAYCDKLIFTATAKGENIANSMYFDAAKLQENFYVGSKVSAYDMLSKVTAFSKSSVDVNSHGFKVELFGVKTAELLDAEGIIKYLSFVAPVPYSAEFTFADKIRAHAESLGHKIDEYQITVNGTQIFKGYTNIISTRGFRDELFDVSFKNFYDGKNLLAWSWIGLTGFKGQIKSDIDSRGLRLRKGNIQIGDETALQGFFKEVRGTYYFVGEVFAVNSQLIPNSQRDYFVPNKERTAFEENLREYFTELYRLYHGASDINSAKKKIRDYRDALDAFPVDGGKSVENIIRAKFKLIEAGDKAKQAQCNIHNEISEARKKSSDNLSRVILYLTRDTDEITISNKRIAPPPFAYRRYTFRNLCAN